MDVAAAPSHGFPTSTSDAAISRHLHQATSTLHSLLVLYAAAGFDSMPADKLQEILLQLVSDVTNAARVFSQHQKLFESNQLKQKELHTTLQQLSPLVRDQQEEIRTLRQALQSAERSLKEKDVLTVSVGTVTDFDVRQLEEQNLILKTDNWLKSSELQENKNRYIVAMEAMKKKMHKMRSKYDRVVKDSKVVIHMQQETIDHLREKIDSLEETLKFRPPNKGHPIPTVRLEEPIRLHESTSEVSSSTEYPEIFGESTSLRLPTAKAEPEVSNRSLADSTRSFQDEDLQQFKESREQEPTFNNEGFSSLPALKRSLEVPHDLSPAGRSLVPDCHPTTVSDSNSVSLSSSGSSKSSSSWSQIDIPPEKLRDYEIVRNTIEEDEENAEGVAIDRSGECILRSKLDLGADPLNSSVPEHGEYTIEDGESASSDSDQSYESGENNDNTVAQDEERIDASIAVPFWSAKNRYIDSDSEHGSVAEENVHDEPSDAQGVTARMTDQFDEYNDISDDMHDYYWGDEKTTGVWADATVEDSFAMIQKYYPK